MQVLLIESGIGTVRAAKAVRDIINLAAPDLVISTGFCGAVKSGLSRGDIVLAEKIFTYNSAHLSDAVSIDTSYLNQLGSTAKIVIHPGTFITTIGFMAKTRITEALHGEIPNPVLEMESHAIAEVCINHGVPFAAIRAVSDTAASDPYHICRKLFDADMNIRLRSLLKTVITEPTITRQLLQLHADAKAAGICLAKAIEFSLENIKCNNISR
jgi:adenosylhomocysteine nucleosidase